jgi:hypothetical protein
MNMRPRICLTAYDAFDDPDCGCETCTTPWGLEFPLVRPAGVIVGCTAHHTVCEGA